jgi:hypothetical protein
MGVIMGPTVCLKVPATKISVETVELSDRN